MKKVLSLLAVTALIACTNVSCGFMENILPGDSAADASRSDSAEERDDEDDNDDDNNNDEEDTAAETAVRETHAAQPRETETPATQAPATEAPATEAATAPGSDGDSDYGRTPTRAEFIGTWAISIEESIRSRFGEGFDSFMDAYGLDADDFNMLLTFTEDNQCSYSSTADYDLSRYYLLHPEEMTVGYVMSGLISEPFDGEKLVFYRNDGSVFQEWIKSDGIDSIYGEYQNQRAVSGYSESHELGDNTQLDSRMLIGEDGSFVMHSTYVMSGSSYEYDEANGLLYMDGEDNEDGEDNAPARLYIDGDQLTVVEDGNAVTLTRVE